jgi:ABC-type iron transport system FetAB permease component
LAARVDRAVGRLLRVQPVSRDEALLPDDGWPFETPLLVSAVRCSLRYIVLPFVLPLAGMASGAALGLLLALDVIATIAIVGTLRRLWRTQHPSRWQYLLLAIAFGVLIGFFFANDARVLHV